MAKVTREQFDTTLPQRISDNDANEITPAIHRAMVKDLVDSVAWHDEIEGFALTQHEHIIADITDFDPSAFALVGHSHDVAAINGFDEAVQGVIASSLVAGSNVTITPSSGTFTIAATGGGGEGAAVDDTAYGPTWDGDTANAPSKNVVYDVIRSLDDAKAAVDHQHNINEIAGAGTAALADIESFTPAAHMADEENPHGVTAGQVGLGNVNNTPDADKPISSAQRAGLMATIAHGGLSGEARPTGAAAVYWIGSVAPLNAADNDLWFNPAGDAWLQVRKDGTWLGPSTSPVEDPPVIIVTLTAPTTVEVEANRNGTIYWLLDEVETQDGPTIKAGGGLASGSHFAGAGVTTKELDLSHVAAGTYVLHLVQDTEDGFSNVHDEADFILEEPPAPAVVLNSNFTEGDIAAWEAAHPGWTISGTNTTPGIDPAASFGEYTGALIGKKTNSYCNVRVETAVLAPGTYTVEGMIHVGQVPAPFGNNSTVSGNGMALHLRHSNNDYIIPEVVIEDDLTGQPKQVAFGPVEFTIIEGGDQSFSARIFNKVATGLGSGGDPTLLEITLTEAS